MVCPGSFAAIDKVSAFANDSPFYCKILNQSQLLGGIASGLLICMLAGSPEWERMVVWIWGWVLCGCSQTRLTYKIGSLISMSFCVCHHGENCSKYHKQYDVKQYIILMPSHGD